MKIIIEKLTEDIINFIMENESENLFIGSLQLSIYGGYVYLNHIVIANSYRSNGYASKLMTAACEFIENERQEIVIMKLDDMTSFCRKPNCIYLKLGFKYDEDTGTEMSGRLCDIRRKY